MGETFISPDKVKALQERMKALGIHEADIEERFIRAQGRGGQKVNKTSSCVHIRHMPTGMEVKCQETRSREANRFFARRILADKVEEKALGRDSSKNQAIERIRRQKRKRAKRSREKAGTPGTGPA
jgi:protein subunit release factor B